MAITAVEVEAAKQAYYDNADYESDASVAKAKLFIAACTRLMILIPASAAQGGESISMPIAQIESAMNYARKWLSINDSSSTQVPAGVVRYADTRNFRR